LLYTFISDYVACFKWHDHVTCICTNWVFVSSLR